MQTAKIINRNLFYSLKKFHFHIGFLLAFIFHLSLFFIIKLNISTLKAPPSAGFVFLGAILEKSSISIAATKNAEEHLKAINIMQKSHWNPPTIKPSYAEMNRDKEKKWFKPTEDFWQAIEVIKIEPGKFENYKPLSIDQ